MRRPGQVQGQRLRGTVIAALLLVPMTAVPPGAAAGGSARETAVTVRVDDTPGPTAPTETQPDPQPTDTRTDDPEPHPPAAPSLTPPREPVEQGESFTVTGSDFDCSEDADLAGPLTLTVQGQDPVNLTVDGTGGFTQSVTVPADAAVGTHEMTAYCTAVDDAPTAEAVFEVVEPTRPAPQISLSPDSGQPQEEPTLTGTGFLCDEGAGVDVVWDGEPVAAGTPGASGDFTITLSVPSDAEEGEHKVTARCGAPGEVQASAAFTVNPVPVSNPPEDPREVTIHLTGYPGACAQGSIVIGGRRLDTWLDADSYEGDAGAGRWEFIDLHAPVPGDMAGRRDVELECAGKNREKAGEISLPPADQLTYFALPTGTTAHPEKKTGAITPSPTGGDTNENGGGGSHSSSGGDTGGNGGGGSHSSSGGSTGANGRGTGGTPGHNPAPGLVEALRTPAHVSWALKDLAGSAAMAAWFLMLVLLLERAFPNQLADNAIGRWWRCRRQRRQRRRPPRQARLPGWARMCGFALLGGSLAVWADVRTGWSPSTAAKTVGAAAGILMVLVAYEKTKESLLRPRGIGFRSELRVVPAGLLLAALMTAMSRFLEFPVPYVYGLIAVYLVLGTPRPGAGQMPKGQAVLIGGICVLATAVLVWVLSAPLVEAAQRGHAPPGSLRYVIAYTLGLAVVAGIEVVVFGLLPLSGMDGHALKHWNKPAWYALYLTGLTFYFHVLLHSLHPGVGTGLAVDGDLRWWTLGIATCLFLAAWAFSLALRWYVARYERQTHS